MVAERMMAGILGDVCVGWLVGWWLNELMWLFVCESVLVVCACMWKVMKKRERESGDGNGLKRKDCFLHVQWPSLQSESRWCE